VRPCVGQCAHIIDERIDPHVDDLAVVPRDRDAPGMARATEAEVLQATLDERARLVVTEARQDKVRPRVVEVEQGLLKGGELEEVVRLLDSLGHSPVNGALAVDQLGLRLELFTADAVETGVDVLVDVAVVVDPLDELLDESLRLCPSSVVRMKKS